MDERADAAEGAGRVPELGDRVAAEGAGRVPKPEDAEAAPRVLERGGAEAASRVVEPGGAEVLPRVLELSDPVALRALAHPLRMKLVGLLRTKGPLTATQAAALVGESTGSTSFHLRQLAKYGLVEEAGGGQGRQKPWRATAQFTSWPNPAAAPEAAVAIAAMNASVAQVYTNLLAQWLRTNADEPAEWQEAAGTRDSVVYVTADELVEFTVGVEALLAGLLERTQKPELRPQGARAIQVITMALPCDPTSAG